MAELLLREGKADANHANADGWTALMYASGNGNVSVAELLLREGKANANHANADGSTALVYALQRGHASVP